MLLTLIIAAAVITLAVGVLIGYLTQNDSKGLTYLLAIVASIVVGGLIVRECMVGLGGGENASQLFAHFTMYSGGLLPLVVVAVAVVGGLALIAVMFVASFVGYFIGTTLKPK
jgi:hypothetical protein